MKRFASIIFFLIFCLALSAQTDSIYLKGKYFESNLYVFNPSVGDNFSVCMYVINGDSIYNELKSNAIEIDFQLLGIQIEADGTQPVAARRVHAGNRGHDPPHRGSDQKV